MPIFDGPLMVPISADALAALCHYETSTSQRLNNGLLLAPIVEWVVASEVGRDGSRAQERAEARQAAWCGDEGEGGGGWKYVVAGGCSSPAKIVIAAVMLPPLR